MKSKESIISKLETLITQYAQTNGIDSDTDKMISILSEYSEKGFLNTWDTAFLSDKLGISPQYIHNDTDKTDIDSRTATLMKIISDTADLSDEYMEYLSEYTVQIKDICINNRSISDDVEIVYIDDSEAYHISNNSPIVKIAQPKTKYNKDNTNKSDSKNINDKK